MYTASTTASARCPSSPDTSGARLFAMASPKSRNWRSKGSSEMAIGSDAPEATDVDSGAGSPESSCTSHAVNRSPVMMAVPRVPWISISIAGLCAVLLVAPAASPYPVSPAKSGGGGCGRTLGCGCLVLLVLLVACAGGAYFAVRSGALTTATFLNLAGLGPARIEVDNFREDAISVNFLQTDAAKDSTPIQGSIQLNAFDVKTFHTPNAAKFRIDFATTAGRTSAGSCNLTVRSGDVFQFVALPDKILINRVNSPPQTGTDLVVQSSSLCR